MQASVPLRTALRGSPLSAGWSALRPCGAADLSRRADPLLPVSVAGRAPACAGAPVVGRFASGTPTGGDAAWQDAAWTSFYCLRCGVTIAVMALRLGLFATLLLVPFLRVGYGYFADPRVRRSIRCGPGFRNFVDVYCPAEAAAALDGTGPKVPVVVAVMGGAWVINHRAWNAQLGQRLMDAGVIMVAVDYRSWPFGRVPDMVGDISLGLEWVFENVQAYGGDPANVVLTGQSAGAQLSALLLLQQSMSEARLDGGGKAETGGGGEAAPAAWSPRHLRGYVGISGAYDLPEVGRHLEERWLGSWLLRRMCPGRDWEACSPAHLLRSADWHAVRESAVAALPPVLLFHGERDKTVPASVTTEFAEALRATGVASVVADVRPGLAHAEVIIEGPMRGEDYEVQLLLPFLSDGHLCQARLAALPPLRPMYPVCIINLASRFMPF